MSLTSDQSWECLQSEAPQSINLQEAETGHFLVCNSSALSKVYSGLFNGAYSQESVLALSLSSLKCRVKTV